MTFSEVVTVTGVPQLTLTIGTESKTANYTSGSGTVSLVFGYTVVAGDTDADGIEIATDQLSLNNGTITDTAGNAAMLTHTALTVQALHKVDTTEIQEPGEALAQQGPSMEDQSWPGDDPPWENPNNPIVGGPQVIGAPAITSTPSSDSTYKTGETIQVTVTFSGAVKVTGTPTLPLKIDTADKTANYTSGTGTTKLVFEYTVASGDMDTDGIEIEANALHKAKNALAGTITDTNDVDILLTHLLLVPQPGHKVDTTSPIISRLAIQSTNPPYGVGEKIQVQMTFSESVTVTGTPQLTLKIGNADKTANYKSGSPGTALVFEYTVAANDNDTDGISIAANQLVLNNGTIAATDDSTAATLTHAALAPQTSHTVDTTAPTVATTNGISITSTATDNTYNTGDTIQATVTFTESVTVTGTPQLTLNIGGSDKTANWTSGTGTASLIFGYTVVSGDTDTDGIEIEAGKLTLNGGTNHRRSRQRRDVDAHRPRGASLT